MASASWWPCFCEAAGLKRATIYWRKKTELPGWFRAEKNWDLLVVADGKLVAIVEFKSQVGSFGNNFNNRTEEALGNATDLWAAYEEGAFSPSERPWLGYLMILEDAPAIKAGSRERTTLPGLPGIQGRFLRRAVQPTPDQAGAETPLRCWLLADVFAGEWLEGRVPRSEPGTKLSQFRSLAAGAGRRRGHHSATWTGHATQGGSGADAG